MADKNSKPVVVLIYANTGSALNCLKPETDTIAAHLKDSGLCDVRLVPAATLSDVVTAITDPELQHRVAIVHYAGHANGQGIQLQSSNSATQGETAYMRGLAEVLKQQPYLRLLFINGCASREQVLELTQAGIPLVIATNRGIDDKAARDFAEFFYRTLGQQRSIIEAFQVAVGSLQAGAGTNVRSVYFGEFKNSTAAQNNEWPWELHGPDVDRHWSLRDPYYRGTGPRWDHTKFAFNPESPYLGLRYFEEEDSSRFFGRDDLVQTLLKASESAPLLFVIGASGTGKSSVVRAGMIPHWNKKHRGASRGRAFVFTPQDDPFEQLSTTLAAVDTFDRQQIRSVREAPSRTALRDAVKTLGQGEPWLIFVDQFEQIFTRTTDQKKRADFLDAIADLAKSEHPNVCLVLAMRDDFFPQLRDYPELFPLTDKHCFRVAALSRAALQEVIERPAAENGVTFQPGLVGNIIDAIDRQPGALPLLQYALDALWKADDLSERLLNETTYTALGGVTGSLGRRLQEMYDHQDLAGKDHFRWMMLKLVTYDEGATGSTVVSRLAPKSEFVGKQAELLDQLIAQGLVVSSGTSTPSVQLGHEKIIEAWQEFTKWTEECREANTVRQQLSKAASEWAELAAQNKKQKTTRALWQGSQLGKALELRQRGDFDQLGGLDSNDKRFLDASHTRSQRMIRGLQWAIGIALMLMMAALGLGSFGWWSYGKAETARKELLTTNTKLTSKTKEAEDNAREALRQSASLYWRHAVTARDQELPVMAAFNFLAAAEGLRKAGDEIPRRNNELAAQFATSSLIRSFPHDAYVNEVRVSRTESRVLSTGSDGQVKLWDVTNPEPLQIWKHGEGVRDAIFSQDEARVLSWSQNSSGDGHLTVWDVNKAQPLQVWENQRFIQDAVFTRNARSVLCRCGDTLKLWDVGNTEPVMVWKHDTEVRGAEFTHDESRIIMWTGRSTLPISPGEVKLLDVSKSLPLQVFKHNDAVNDAVFNRDESRVLSWSSDGDVKLWDVNKSEPLKVWKHDGSVNGAVFTRDESRVLSWSGSDGVVKLWDASKAEPIQAWKHKGGVLGAALTRDESHVLAWSGEFGAGEVKLWDVSKAEPVQAWKHDGLILGAMFTRDESRVLARSDDGVVKLWDVTKAEPIQVWKPGRGGTHVRKQGLSATQEWKQGLSAISAVFTRDETCVLTWGYDAIHLWDVTKAEPIQVWKPGAMHAVLTRDESHILTWSPIKLWRLTNVAPPQGWQHESAVNGLVFARDTSRVVTWGTDGTVKLWDSTKAEPLQVWKHDGGVYGAVFTRNDSSVLTWGNSAIKLWDVNRTEPLKVWNHDGGDSGGEFSIDGSRFLTISGNDVTLWDVSKAEPLQVWHHHQGSVLGAVLTRDGSRTVTWSNVGAVKLWDATESRPLQEWRHKRGVLGAVFAQDESSVLAWSGEHGVGEVKLWDVTKSEPLRVWEDNRGVLGAVLTRDESRFMTWNNDRTLKLWDITKADPLKVWQSDFEIYGAVFTRDASRVLAWSGNYNGPGELTLRDVTTSEPLQVWTHISRVNGAVFMRDESRVLAYSGEFGECEVKMWDVSKAEPLHVWNDDDLRRVMFDESRVLAWSGDGAVRAWNAALQDAELTPNERIVELKIRSATRLNSLGQIVPLKSTEWITLLRSPEYASIQVKQKSAESSGPANSDSMTNEVRGRK